MSAQEELKEADKSAVDNVQQPESGFNSRVTGGSIMGASGGKKKKIAGAAATAAIIIILVLSLFLFLGGNFYIDAIQTRFVEVSDVQYADEVQSKELVFQKALKEGKIPINTFNRLKEAEVIVGYLEGETFIESNVGPIIEEREPPEEDRLGPLSVKMDDKIISADDFYYEINHNIKLYGAFTKSTYGRAAYYYDEKAQQVFEKVGISGSNSVATTRNNFTGDEDFKTTMDKIMGDENPVGFDDQTWHYMPTWRADEGCRPVLDGWVKVTDEFSCTGTNVTKIATWRVAKFTPVCRPTGLVDENGEAICIPSCDFAGYDYSYEGYGCNGESAESYIKAMSQANMSKDNDIQTIKNTTDSLKAADTLSKKQKSMRLYSGFMESISRTKAGYGSYNTETDKIIAAFGAMGATTGGSHVNDVMNALFEVKNTEVVDVVTGEKKILTGSMMESPSVYAILTGEKVDLQEVADFSSDRILKTIGNSNPEYTVDDSTIIRTATNKKSANESTIGRYTPNPDGKNEEEEDGEKIPVEFRDYTPDGSKIIESQGSNFNHGEYSANDIGLVELTIQNSLYNTFDETVGVSAGELLAEGAINLGTELAKASGAAPGDEEAVVAYLKLTSDILAMDAEVDRMNRSPLDITSKNTFLGSLVYKFAVSSIRSGSLLNKIASFSRITNKAVASILPAAFAEEESDSYFSTFGDCDTLSSIGAAGSPTCSMIATFDVTTYTVPQEVAVTEPFVIDISKKDLSIYDSSEFQKFVEDNVTCDSNNNCEINDKETCKKIFGECNDDKAILAKFVTFNENRNTPAGLTDASLVENMKEWENMNKSWFQRTWASIASLFGLIDDIDNGDVPDEATGKEFVYKAKNSIASSDDADNMWNKYKYAQRYISLARAAETMRQYDGDETAYMFDGFGKGDPVARYIDKLNQTSIASNY